MAKSRQLNPPHPQVLQLKSLYETAVALHRESYDLISVLGDNVKDKGLGPYTMPDMVDLGFYCREFENLCDEWRKDAKARKELIGNNLALKVTELSLASGRDDTTVQGNFSRGSCDCKMLPKLPNKGTPEYSNLLSHLGVSPETQKRGLVKMDFEAMEKHVTQCKQFGDPLPPGIGGTYTIYFTTFTRIRNQ